MTDETANRIQIAADLIASEMFKRGAPITEADCLAIARQLHNIWEQRQVCGQSSWSKRINRRAQQMQ